MYETLSKAICKLRKDFEKCCKNMKDFLTVEDLANPNNDIKKLYVDGKLVIGGGGSGSSIYNPGVSDSMKAAFDHGGIPKGTEASSLRGLTYDALFDKILFPTVLAKIGENRSGLLVISPAERVYEIGTVVDLNISMIFNRGTIINGDGSLNINALVGEAWDYSLFKNGNLESQDNLDGLVDGNFIIQETITMGDTTFNGLIDYHEGTGSYFDNTGSSGTNLDGYRIADSVSTNDIIIKGAMNIFYGDGVIATDGTAVRSLNSTLMDSPTTGFADLIIHKGELENTIAIPKGRILKVVLERSNANVTDLYTKAEIQVPDAGGAMHDYDVYSYTATEAYPNDVLYKITVT